MRRFLKNMLVRTNSPLVRFWLPTYRYNISTYCLAALCGALDQTQDITGTIVEVGCATGATTVFLNRHMDDAGIDKPYVAIDTFAGFTADDVEYEVSYRGKSRQALSAAFRENSLEWFRATLRLNGIRRVQAIQADINHYDFGDVGQVSLAFLDVDLYRPMAAALRQLWVKMAARGLMIVHDCRDGGPYDGAFQAYREFVAERRLQQDVRHNEFAVIKA